MEVGVIIPNAGPKASAENIIATTRVADALGFHSSVGNRSRGAPRTRRLVVSVSLPRAVGLPVRHELDRSAARAAMGRGGGAAPEDRHVDPRRPAEASVAARQADRLD